ncbi:restriction endonuclease [Listeria marthii]|uniref:Sau3AI family type II restriction endonuclease n=1 Tax=Listeria marthii TaxID=529731 RepID=UPI001887298C|nr:Sau3AI family type II restriction endonuclease [Listeria marthii]MBF2392779.1 restriction endonuclease [Listeria marthii]
MKKTDLYDVADPIDIERYAKELIGKTFKQVLEENYTNNEIVFEEKVEYYTNPRGKGSLGNLIEKYYFGYEPNSSPEPDFPEAGVELKVTPYEALKKKGKFKAGERLVVSMIPNDKEVEDEFNSSHLIKKLNLILLVLYLREKGEKRVDFKIDYAKLFSVTGNACKEDLLIIESDYNKIVSKIKQGKAHELSEGDTVYLGACTKGATAEKSLKPQFYNAEIPAKRRAFCLKQGYMTYLLNKYIFGDIDTYDKIIKKSDEMHGVSFENYVLEKINKYVGKNVHELRVEFGMSHSKLSKSHYSQLAFAMLGVKSNNAEEFIKANIVVKAIRLNEENKLNESMSFPTINFKEFAEEEWEDSIIYNYFSETKFLFVIFKKTDEGYIFKGSQFWNMPNLDLETKGKKEWLEAQTVIKEGVEFQIGAKDIRNNLLKEKNTTIFHLRPHAAKSSYLINGIEYGNGNIDKHTDVLPNGDLMTKQSFWLNKSYVLNAIDDKFKK